LCHAYCIEKAGKGLFSYCMERTGKGLFSYCIERVEKGLFTLNFIVYQSLFQAGGLFFSYRA
jgi:hypothetical protein